METPIDGSEQPVHLLIGRWHRLVDQQAPAVLDRDAVEHERMDVDIQIQGSAETLNDRYGPAASTGHVGLAGSAPKRPEHRPHEDTRNGAAQCVVPRQYLPKAMRQTQDPLPYRHDRKHVIDQMGRALRHTPAAAARADGPPLTGKRHETIEPTPAAAESREPTRQEPAAQEALELLLDEPRERIPLVDTRRFGAKCFEVVVDHLIQHGLRRRLRRVG